MNYHYVYRITDKLQNKHYYGTRTSKNRKPIEDIGIYYFSSSHDKEFIYNQKNNSLNFKYKIIKICNTRKEAIELEIKLHNKFNVGINEKFFNRCKQTSTKWDTGGTIRPSLSEEQIEKQKDTITKIQEDGFSIAQKSYKKRNETLLKKDKNFLKTIGLKSSETQKLNGKNKGKNNPKFNNKKILVFDYFGNKVDELLRIDIEKSKYPTRAVNLCLGNKTPIYLHNFREEFFEFAGYHFCFEDDLSFNLLTTRANNNYNKIKERKCK